MSLRNAVGDDFAFYALVLLAVAALIVCVWGMVDAWRIERKITRRSPLCAICAKRIWFFHERIDSLIDFPGQRVHTHCGYQYLREKLTRCFAERRYDPTRHI